MKMIAPTLAVAAALIVTGSAFASTANTRGAFSAIDANKHFEQQRAAYALTGEKVVRQRMHYDNRVNIGSRAAH